MRLEDMAQKAIGILKEYGNEGILTAELAKILHIPKRRVYDVLAILKAADLVSTKRKKQGTTLFWQGDNNSIVSNENRIRSNKIKVTTTGFITSVSNKGTEVIIESTSPSMTIEPIR